MIKFDGIALEDVANVKIVDIKVSPISTEQVARVNYGTGSTFVRTRDGQRTVTITFALLDSDIDNRVDVLQSITEWAKNDREYTLQLPMQSNKHLECLCTERPDPSYRMWWESKLRLTFTTFSNPYWTSDNVTEVQCGQTFTVAGSAVPLMTIERNVLATLTNQSYICGTDVMRFTQIPAGKLLIDLNKELISVSGSTIMQYLTPTSTFIKPQIGANQKITGTGTIRFRERWL